MTKIQIKTIWWSILFEYEKENNTIKDTLIQWVKEGADLRGAKNCQETSRANMCRQNLLYIFNYLPNEVEWLKDKLLKWEIDGTQYKWECCCLIGSLWDDEACNIIPFYEKWLHNYWEQLFYQIRQWDTPENNEFSKLAIEMCDLFIGNTDEE